MEHKHLYSNVYGTFFRLDTWFAPHLPVVTTVHCRTFLLLRQIVIIPLSFLIFLFSICLILSTRISGAPAPSAYGPRL